MTEVFSKRITYQELKDGSYVNAYVPNDSKFHVTSHLTPYLRDALIACPWNYDESKTFMYLFVDRCNKEIGRVFLFGTCIKGGNKLCEAQTACGHEVVEDCRGEGLGTELLLYLNNNNEYDFILLAGISLMVLPIYYKLNYYIFEVQQYYKVRNVKYLVRSSGLRSALSRNLHAVKLWFKERPSQIKCNKIKKNLIVKNETIIPEWVEEMIASDGHKYMEVHNQKWLQWNLDYKTYGYDEDIQSFYSISDKDNTPLGFFMTKERIIKKPGPNNGFVVGTVVEWESCNKKVLSEVDINLLAAQTFSKNVDVIFTLACECGTASQLEKMGYHERATFKVGVKDKKKQFEDIGDKNLWRLRYGMTNMGIL